MFFRKRKVYNTLYVKTITEGTTSNMEKVKALSENYVIKNAKRANKLIEEMKKRTEKEKVDKKKISSFVQQLKDIIKFYEDITTPKKVETTKKELVEYYSATENFYKEIDNILNNLKTDSSKLKSELELIPNDDSRENNLRRQSLQSQIVFSNNAINMLMSFKGCYYDLMPTLKKVESDVSYFILAISESVKVYKKAVQVAELSQNISNAIDTIEQLNKLNSLSSQITESWKNLQEIMEKLSDIQHQIAA